MVHQYSTRSYTFYVESPVNSRQRIDVFNGQVICIWSNPDNALTQTELENPIPFIESEYQDLQEIESY